VPGDARNRKLDQAWDSAASFSFDLDGHSPAAKLITELGQEVFVYRWDEQTGVDKVMFHGPITQAQDQLTEDSHLVSLTCHDYFALLDRRLSTSTWTTTGTDQDGIVSGLLGLAANATTSSSVSLQPGCYLPLARALVNPDGSARGLSGQNRDRTYPASTLIGTAIDELAKVIGGFDYDVLPSAVGPDQLRMFYPSQGITRSSPALVYGSTVSTVTRSVDSANYANYWRTIGNNGSSDPTAAQRYSEAWNGDASAGQAGAVGLWMSSDTSSNDVTLQPTLDERVQGDLANSGILIPTYTLGLRPGAYSYGNPNMGDTVPLVVQSGRLNVSTTIRVLGFSFAIGDDGAEDVSLTVGRPDVNFSQLLAPSQQSIQALVRR
jgi:hypothetical protein